MSKNSQLSELIDGSTALGGKFGVQGICGTEVLVLLEDLKYQTNTIVDLSGLFEILRQYRLYILGLDGYDFRGDCFKIKCHVEGFSDMEVEELLDIFNETDKSSWEQDREYFYALFKMIEDKLEEKGINLGFTDLFEQGI